MEIKRLSKASTRTVDVVLGSLIFPTWGLFHGLSNQVETNVKKISELVAAVRTSVGGDINPGSLEAQRSSIDRKIDDAVFDLYGMGPEDRSLVRSIEQ